jgi:hypothetical protein
MKRIIQFFTIGFFLFWGSQSHAAYEELYKLNLNYAATTSIYVEYGGGNYCYFYDSYYNIFSIDITDPELPVLADLITLLGNPGLERKVAIRGNHLYAPRSGVANPDMDIVNISDPSNLFLENEISLGTVRNLVIEGNYLYATGDGPLSVYDISTGGNPALSWQSDNIPTQPTFDIDVRNGIVYAAGEDIKVSVIDTPNKLIVNSIDIPDNGRRVRISGNYLYVGGVNSTLRVYNISNPLIPILVEIYTTISDQPLDMEIEGDFLYYVGNQGEIEIIDISVPTDLVQSESLPAINAKDVFVDGDYIFAATEGGLTVLGPPPVTSSSGGGCFIATAAYGSYWEPHVMTLRQLRDSYLLTNKLGNRFVNAYYKYSPPLADVIGGHDSLRAMVRAGLVPVVGFSWLAVNYGMIMALTVFLSLMAMFIGGTYLMVSKREIKE